MPPRKFVARGGGRSTRSNPLEPSRPMRIKVVPPTPEPVNSEDDVEVEDLVSTDPVSPEDRTPYCALTDVNSTDLPGLKKLDVDELLKTVETWSGASCLHMMKWAEGRHHVVYRCQFRKGMTSNVSDIILRLCKPYYKRKKLESEVATTHYIRKHITSIPVPAVLYANYAPTNPLGCEYSIHALASGVTARTMWPLWSNEERFTMLDQLAEMLHAMFMHRPSVGGEGEKYGALYRPTKARTEGDSSEYIIGPMIEESAFDRSFDPPSSSSQITGPPPPRLPPPNGPYHTPSAWLSSNPSHQLSQLEHQPLEAAALLGWDPNSTPNRLEPYKLLLREILRLARVCPGPPRLKGGEEPALWRPCLGLEDILALPDKGTLTALLDWELTAIVPRWQAACLPSFLEEQDGKPAELPAVYRERFLARMRDLDERAALQAWEEAKGRRGQAVVGWVECYEQGRMWREVRRQCAREWWEMDGGTAGLVDRWAAFCKGRK